MNSKPLLVGELNPYGTDPRFALYPLPARASGGNLAAILGMAPRAYLRAFERVNLCTGKWLLSDARSRALALILENDTYPRRAVILLGSKVCFAFGVKYAPFTTPMVPPGSPSTYLVLPHPSGLNRVWNASGARAKARAAVNALYPPGEEPCAKA